MRPFTNLSGRKFNMLIVLKLHHKDANFRPFYLCKCDCGNEVIVRSDCFKSKNTQSCGCLNKKLSSERLIKAITTHGLSLNNKRLYRIWAGMKYRCGKEGVYKKVRLCLEWKKFVPFYKWSKLNGYSDLMTIDRKNPHGNYCPNNCRWIPKSMQGENIKNSIRIFWKGKNRTLKQWSKETGIKYSTLYFRHRKSDSPEVIFRRIK